MPERTAARAGFGNASRRRVVVKCSDAADEHEADAHSTISPPFRLWSMLGQEIGVLVCELSGASAVVALLTTGRRNRDLGLSANIWRFFCRQRWGGSANLAAYSSAKELYMDGNGWYRTRCGHSVFGADPADRCYMVDPADSRIADRYEKPIFTVRQMRVQSKPALTMDLRMTDQEVVAVSEAVDNVDGNAEICIVDHRKSVVNQRIDVSNATINCCDVGPDLICLGSDDSKVRLYSRSRECSSGSGGDAYRLASTFSTTSEVNDIRYTQEGFIIAVRTHQNRHPAGIDLIPVDRPESKRSFHGASWATRGKYIHAVDGFEAGCSLGAIACSGEHPVTSAFSAMLFDFRCSMPCVMDLPVTSLPLGCPIGTMLWPLRAGREKTVYANLLHDDQISGRRSQGTIAMVDFRYSAPWDPSQMSFQLPYPVDDFRCSSGHIYACCTERPSRALHILRCQQGVPDSVESLRTVVEVRDPPGQRPYEDLKVLSVCEAGFALSYDHYMAMGTIADPRKDSRPDMLVSSCGRELQESSLPDTPGGGGRLLRDGYEAEYLGTY